MPAIDSGYVIKATTGAYYCGYSYIDKQMRKAKIYHSLKYALDAIKSLKESAKFRNFEFIIVNVEVREVIEDAGTD
jgi:hypothetical protein